jgi:hypothetical protein
MLALLVQPTCLRPATRTTGKDAGMNWMTRCWRWYNRLRDTCAPPLVLPYWRALCRNVRRRRASGWFAAPGLAPDAFWRAGRGSDGSVRVLSGCYARAPAPARGDVVA